MTGPLNTSRNRNTPPIQAPWAHPALEEGRHEFNRGRHWHAHEAWEPLWMGLEGDEKLFVQGLIMAAAMLVQYGKHVPRGVANHWQNVLLRLDPNRPQRWGIDVEGLLGTLERFAASASAGDWSLDPATVQVRRSPVHGP